MKTRVDARVGNPWYYDPRKPPMSLTLNPLLRGAVFHHLSMHNRSEVSSPHVYLDHFTEPSLQVRFPKGVSIKIS